MPHSTVRSMKKSSCRPTLYKTCKNISKCMAADVYRNTGPCLPEQNHSKIIWYDTKTELRGLCPCIPPLPLCSIFMHLGCCRSCWMLIRIPFLIYRPVFITAGILRKYSRSHCGRIDFYTKKLAETCFCQSCNVQNCEYTRFSSSWMNKYIPDGYPSKQSASHVPSDSGKRWSNDTITGLRQDPQCSIVMFSPGQNIVRIVR